jgi:signal transduction histidine kinase
MVDALSTEKARNFLAALNQEGVTFGWDLNVSLEGRLVPMPFNGARIESGFLIVAAITRSAATRFIEALSAITSQQSIELRSALKQLSEQQRHLQGQESNLFDELSKLNNELVTLQRELASKNRDLEKLNRLKDTFLAMASHDLRKPISGILTLADLLFDAERPPSPSQQTHLSTLKSACNKVIRQLNDFLDIAQIETGHLRIEKRPTALGLLVAGRLRMHRDKASEKQITLVAEIPQNIPSLHLDGDRIEQVVDNLIENALKYTPTNGTVTVRLQVLDSGVTLSVADTGPGLTPEQTGMLFAPFQTAGTKTTGGEKSTGLGLAIVKAIVDEHGASISVRDVTPHGAAFTVTFPCVSLKMD